MSQNKLKPAKMNVRIYHTSDKIENTSMHPSQFTEKYVNQILGGMFESCEGPNDTQIFVVQRPNGKIPNGPIPQVAIPDEDLVKNGIVKNTKASEMWHQAGHKDDLYGTVIQVPISLADIFFRRMQKIVASDSSIFFWFFDV